MSASNLYEDLENRVQIHPNRRTAKRNDTSIQNKQNISANRTALSAININSQLRVQPSRAAKQAIYCDSTSFASTISERTLSSGIGGLSFPSFHIHEDSSTSSDCSASSSSTNASSKVTNKAKLKDLSLKSITQSPVKNKLSKFKSTKDLSIESGNDSNKENEVPFKQAIRALRTLPALDSPMDMDTAVCDTMVVDTPIVRLTEELLQRNDDDLWDVPEYAADIYNYLREAEVCHKARANYMVKQTDISSSMRWILVDWLVEVSEEYSLHTETLYLAVSYIDRFLSHMSVKRDKLQLVGTTAMFIASKYEEIYPPDVGQFAYITDNTYRVSQILRMEHLILKVLSFDMAVPTAYVFVNKFSKMCKCSDETLNLALFISELSMLDSDPFLRYLPSVIAASAVAIANHTQGRVAWPDEVAIQSRYSLDDLRECYVNLHRAYCRVSDSQQHAIREKYKVVKWNCVSNIAPREGFPW